MANITPEWIAEPHFKDELLFYHRQLTKRNKNSLFCKFDTFLRNQSCQGKAQKLSHQSGILFHNQMYHYMINLGQTFMIISYIVKEQLRGLKKTG